MEQNIIKIKCPCCGTVLQVKDEPGLAEKSTTCPVCKQKNQIKNFKKVYDRQEEKTEYPTEYPKMKGASGYSEMTEVVNNHETAKLTLGRLMVLPSGPSYQLRPGQNIIGRKHTETEHADFELQTNGKRMSRQHLNIEVKKVPGKGFVHYISLCGQKANPTFVGDNRLDVGDCVVINDGDIIKLPDMPDISVKFEIPDGEKTIYD